MTILSAELSPFIILVLIYLFHSDDNIDPCLILEQFASSWLCFKLKKAREAFNWEFKSMSQKHPPETVIQFMHLYR